MCRLITVLCCLLLTGCVSLTTGLQIAQFGVNIGFDSKDYVDEKKEELKEIVDDQNRSND